MCGLLYQLVLKYDNADWKGMAPLAAELNIDANIVSQKYLECVEFVNQIWNDLMSPYTTETAK